MKTWVGYALYLLVVIYNLLDVWHTYLLLGVGATEINPLVAMSIGMIGVVPGILIIKIPVLLFLGVLLYLHSKSNKRKNNLYNHLF